MEPAVIIMMLSVFFLLLSITVGLYSLFCGLLAAGDVRRMRNSTALRTGESDDKDKKVSTPLPRLAEAGIEVDGTIWIILLVLLAGAGALIGFMALGLIGIGFALIGPLIAELWVRSRGKSRKARFDEQLARSLPMVAENMRAGSSIERALRSVGENSDDPLKSELLACAGAMQIDGDIVAARTLSSCRPPWPRTRKSVDRWPTRSSASETPSTPGCRSVDISSRRRHP